MKVKVKGYNFISYGQIFFDQLFKHNLRTYDNIQKIETGRVDDYTTGCLLEYPYFKEHCKIIAIDISKQQVLDADQKQYNKLISLKT